MKHKYGKKGGEFTKIVHRVWKRGYVREGRA